MTGVTRSGDARYRTTFHASAYFVLRGRCKMRKDERDLLEVLKSELEFLEGRELPGVAALMDKK